MMGCKIDSNYFLNIKLNKLINKGKIRKTEIMVTTQVIPAKAGIQIHWALLLSTMDSRFRGNDLNSYK